MRVRFVNEFKSLLSSERELELPGLTVLVGRNGAGKSHLLEAIENREAVQCFVDGVRLAWIRRYGIEGLVPVKMEPQSSSPHAERWRDFAGVLGRVVEGAQRQEADHRWRQAVSDDPAFDLRASRRDALVQSGAISATALNTLEDALGRPLIDGEMGSPRVAASDDFLRRHAPITLRIDPFAFQVGAIFCAYYEAWGENENRLSRKATGRPFDAEPMEAEEFIVLHGQPPWTQLNSVLRDLELPLRFDDYPDTGGQMVFSGSLLDERSGARLSTDVLSGGEKLLLALALLRYASMGEDPNFAAPDVLLLDEVDAVLHPRMVGQMLEIIERDLVASAGIHVILVSHSPVTAALAPEESLYEMRRLEVPRIAKVSREQALSRLSLGVPRLSVRVEDRRVVFVESADDAARHSSLYGALRDAGEIQSDVSLQFFPSGRKKDASGKDVVEVANRGRVIDLVKGLVVEGEVRGVLGLVDWDCLDVPEDVAQFVVAPRNRYTLENFVLDPVAVVHSLAAAGRLTAEALGPIAQDYPDLGTAQDLTQTAVDLFVGRVGLSGEEQVNVKYLGGAEVSLPKSLLIDNGHGLKARVIDRIPEVLGLPGVHKGDKLCEAIINIAFMRRPALTPIELVDAYQELCDR